MVQTRIGKNFDIDAITRLVNADINAPALAEQPFVDPVADAFAADVDDMVDELRFNPSSNLAEEAQQIMNSPLAAKLGAGVMADLRAAVQLQEEKAANGSDAFMRGDRVWEEREKREERDRKDKADNAKFAEDANDASKSMTPQQWDEAPSSDYPGMTNAEALAAIRRINANLPFYSKLAVERGLIKPEDEMAFQAYMRNEQWLKEQERTGKTNTDDYRVRKQQQEQAREAHPEFKPAAQEVAKLSKDRSIENAANAAISGAQGAVVGANAAFDSGTAALVVDDGVKPPVATAPPTSLAKSLDQLENSAQDQPSITGTFNTSASGTTTPPAPTVQPIAPTQPARVASASFDQSAGMI